MTKSTEPTLPDAGNVSEHSSCAGVCQSVLIRKHVLCLVETLHSLCHAIEHFSSQRSGGEERDGTGLFEVSRRGISKAESSAGENNEGLLGGGIVPVSLENRVYV